MTAPIVDNHTEPPPLWRILMMGMIPLIIPFSGETTWSYALSIPWISVCMWVLFKHSRQPFHCAILMILPSIGYISMNQQILFFDLQMLAPAMGILHIFELCQLSNGDAWILLLAGGLAAWNIHHNTGYWIIVMGMLSLAGKFLLWLSYHALLDGFYLKASLSIWGISAIRIIGMIIAIQLFWTISIFRKSTITLLCILSLWLPSPFIEYFLASLPPSQSTLQLPLSKQGIGSLLQPLESTALEVHPILDAQGSNTFKADPWWCGVAIAEDWNQRPRAFALLALSQEERLVDFPHWPQIMHRGITHVGFLTNHHHPNALFPLNKHVTFPVSHWWLDPAPKTASLFEYRSDTIQQIHKGDDTCVLSVSQQQSIQNIIDAEGILRQFQCKILVLNFQELPQIMRCRSYSR